VETSRDTVTSQAADDNGTLRRLSCVATSFIASTGSKTRPQPPANQLGLITELALLLLLLMMSNDGAVTAAGPTHITATHNSLLSTSSRNMNL